MASIRLITTVSLILEVTIVALNCPPGVIDLCKLQKNCEDCIEFHACCNWCFQEYVDITGSRCDSKENLKDWCLANKTESNEQSSVTNVEDKSFQDVNIAGDQNAVQFRPQLIKLTLRKNEPMNVTFNYRPAKNVNLDLYYLMDLTLSMRPDLNNLKDLGTKIFKKISELTKNYRIAFGSYVDKVGMPFYLTDRMNFDNPCRLVKGETCEKGYLFKHQINFTTDEVDFIRKLKRCTFSGNVDNLEGGFDALMQILRCKNELNWMKSSRKLVVLATGGYMHLAGDGLLSGSTKTIPKTCQINIDGLYPTSLIYDYPSLEEVYWQMHESKTNLIIASKNTSKSYYDEIHKLMPYMTYVGTLQSETSNILELISNGYYDFIKKVQLTANFARIEGLDVKFFADCYNTGEFNETSRCFDAKEGKRIRFKARFVLNDYPKRDNEVVTIEEQNIHEKITVKLKFVRSKCKCKGKKGITCVNGHNTCGICRCDQGWTGDRCDEVCKTDQNSCRSVDEKTGEMSTTCHGNGNCNCGKCVCNIGFSGVFCMYKCPGLIISSGSVCSGQGVCIDGSCTCNGDFTGDDCTCSTSLESCQVPGSETICNDRGSCKCNECNCDHPYTGQYCEICNDCEGLCNIYARCVEDFMKSDVISTNCTIQNSLVQLKSSNELEVNSTQCSHKFLLDDDRYCDVLYTYRVINGKNVNVDVSGSCSNLSKAKFMYGLASIVSILALGFLVIGIWKFETSRADRNEFAKFEEARKNLTSMSNTNSLYKSPITTYRNPLRNQQNPMELT